MPPHWPRWPLVIHANGLEWTGIGLDCTRKLPRHCEPVAHAAPPWLPDWLDDAIVVVERAEDGGGLHGLEPQQHGRGLAPDLDVAFEVRVSEMYAYVAAT